MSESTVQHSLESLVYQLSGSKWDSSLDAPLTIYNSIVQYIIVLVMLFYGIYQIQPTSWRRWSTI